MGSFKEKIEVRDLRDGDWYWIQKGIIQEYASEIGAMGITTYNFLASMANSAQTCFPSQKYMASSLGYSRATINKTVKVLEKAGLIKILKRDRYHCVYCLLKIRCQAGKTQMSTGRNPDVKDIDTNDNELKRINKIDIDNKK